MATKIMGSRRCPFGITWRHRPRDHSTRGGRLPIGGPWWPCVYLSLLWPFEVLPGRFFQEQRSVVGRSVGPQYYTDLIYSFSLR